MVRIARRLPLWPAAVVLCTLLACGNGRFLVEQKDAFLGAAEALSSASDGSFGGSNNEATSVLPLSSTSMSPFVWFQYQMGIFAALERAVTQRLNKDLVQYDASDATTSEDLLRHVGCARLRAALLDKAAHQGSAVVTDVSGSDSAASVSGSAEGYSDGEEYIEDYAAGTLASRVAYTLLRGANTGSSVAEAVSGSSSSTSTTITAGGAAMEQAASLSESRSEGYYVDYQAYASSMDEPKHLAGYGNGYSYPDGQYEYEYEYYEEHMEDGDDMEGGEEELSPSKAVVGVEDSAKKAAIARFWTSLFGDQLGLDDLVLSNGQKAAATDVPGSDASATAATDASEPAFTDAVSNAAADFGYDVYDMLDDADMLAGLSDNHLDEFNYGYDDLYEGYYQALTLADGMLANLFVDPAEESWADYLDQAYEYFAFYTDLDNEYYGYLGDVVGYDTAHDDTATSAFFGESPSALAALASIAELVVWAHMGNFVLEVRPTFTVSQVSEDGHLVQSNSLSVISSEPIDGASSSSSSPDATTTAAVFGFAELSFPFPGAAGAEQLLMGAEPPVVINDMSLRWVLPDGRLNWGLVMLIVLSAGTAAMLVGFVASWLALRRSMCTSSQGWVYVPPRAGKRCGGGSGKGGFGYDGCDYGAPLVVRPEDCKGAVCWGGAAAAVEDASEYVLPKQANESVAKALYK